MEKAGDPEGRIQGPPGLQLGEKMGNPSMKDRARRMREEIGPTDGCPACTLQGVWCHGVRHNQSCVRKRMEWEAANPIEIPEIEHQVSQGAPQQRSQLSGKRSSEAQSNESVKQPRLTTDLVEDIETAIDADQAG